MLFFFSLVRPHRLACFGLGPFLRFLVCLSSSLFSSLFLRFLFLILFLGHFLRFLMLSLLRVGLSLPLVFAGLSCLPCVFPGSSTSLLSRSFLLRLLVIIRLCSVCACSGSLGFLVAYFGYLFPPSLSLCLSSFSCQFSSRTSFNFFSLQGVPFPISKVFRLVPVVATRSVFQLLELVFISFL